MGGNISAIPRAEVGPKISRAIRAYRLHIATHGNFTIVLPTLSQTPLLRLLPLPEDGRMTKSTPIQLVTSGRKHTKRTGTGRTDRPKKTASGARAVNTTREHVVNTPGQTVELGRLPN